MKQKSGSKKPKAKVTRTKRTSRKRAETSRWPRCLLPGNARPTRGKGRDYEIQIARKQWSRGVRSCLGTMTIGEGWGAAKAVANLARLDVNLSVERVEALDEASIEPVQRNKQ